MSGGFPRVVQVLILLVVSVGIVFAAKTCPNCGATNKDSDKFCKVCGAKLPGASPSQPALPRVAGSVSVEGSVVRITAEPPVVGVAVDGRNRGKTPLRLDDLGSGRHEVELTRSGYRPYYGEFTISGRFGSLVVTTDPVGAEVLLDSVSRGTAQEGGLALARVPYGRHTVTARLEGYDDAVKTVDLKAAGPLGVALRLGYGRGWLVVESDPPGASLDVNDQTSGETPYVAELEPARYVLSLTRRGYHDWVGDATVLQADTTAVRAILDRIETRKLPLLAAAIVGLGGGIASAVKGQSEYAKYQAASMPEEARKYHQTTMTWDTGRNIALLAGIALGGAYWMVRW